MTRQRMAMTAAALLVTALAARADEAAAVKAIMNAGGAVTRDEKLDGKPVVEVNLTRNKITDAGLKELAPLKSLRRLYLNDARVTDAGLKELKEFKNLQRLELQSTGITDKGLGELKELTSLETLLLDGNHHITDAGLKQLTGLKKLRLLGVVDTKVTDAGIEELKKALPRLGK